MILNDYSQRPLSNLADTLIEETHKIKCKDCDFFLENKNIKDNLIKNKHLSCNKNYTNKIDEKLQNRFKNAFIFFNVDIYSVVKNL